MTWNPFHARRERALRRVAPVFLASPHDRHYVVDIMQTAGVGSGALYPLLARMQTSGWLETGKEDPAPERRRPRRWYRLTGLGRQELLAFLDGGDVLIVQTESGVHWVRRNKVGYWLVHGDVEMEAQS